MPTTVNLTGNIADLIGTDFDPRRTRVWVTTNLTADVLIDATGNEVRLGDAYATVSALGVFTFTGLWATNAATNPTAFQYQLHIDYPKRSSSNGRKTWDSGWFDLTATADIADVVQGQYVPPTWMTTATAELQTYVDAAKDISNIDTSDAVVEALVKNTGGGGPLTSAAIEATVASEGAALFAKARNLEDYPGVDPTGVAECRAAIQAAIDAAAAANVPLVSRYGFYKIATGITINSHCDLTRAVFTYTGTTGDAITVGTAASTLARKTIGLPYIVASAKTVAGWAQVAGTVGVKIINVIESEIHARTVNNFETGLLLYGAAGGVAYNEITLGSIGGNKVNIKFDSDATGYTNGNNFHGGRVGHDGSEGSMVSGTRQILMTNATVPADGNNFYGTSLENPGVAEYLIESYGWHNIFHGCRWENTAAAGNKRIWWRGTAKGNIIEGGYEAELLTVTADSGAKNNVVRSPFVDQSLWIPATSMELSSGTPTRAVVGGVPYWTLRDGFSDEVSADVLIPSGWAKVDVTVVYFSLNGAAGNVRFGGKYQAHAAGATVGSPSWAWFSTQDPPATNVIASTVMSAGLAIAPGPAHFSVAREGADAADTSAGNVGILGVRLDRVA